MANDLAQSLAGCDRGLVVAPAGCGKTYLIAQAVQHDRDRQLVLTHTHAGVRAILNRLADFGVSSSRVRVTTIDSFALRYAAAFPGLSGWRTPNPRGDEWLQIQSAVSRTFEVRAIKQVLRATYRGIYVDEYQDCSSDQHAMLLELAKTLPCRVVGDPMQAIFCAIHKDDALHWATVERDIPKIGELSVPHRWRGRNDDLGDWLLDVRSKLEEGAAIDFSYPCANWRRYSDEPNQIAACKSALSCNCQTVVALRQWRPQCYSLAGKLGNSYISMETVECDELQEYCERIEAANGQARLECVAEFAEICLSRLGQDVRAYPQKLADGSRLNPRKADRIELLNRMKTVVQSNDLAAIGPLLNAYAVLEEVPVFRRRELWSELRRAIRHHSPTSGKSLRDTAWGLREAARRAGRFVPRRCISTTLLVKGLEFDHALVLNMKDFKDPENAYVALTRGAMSLTVLSDTQQIQFPRPAYVAGV
jgi:superfamily I DNA/RNA helicase